MEWAGGLKFSSPLSLYCCISFLSICLILSSWFRYRGAWRISLPARAVNRRWFSKIQISRYFKSRTFFPMATGILRIPLEPVYADGLSETVLIFSIISSSQHIVRNRDSLHGSYFSGISGMKEKLPIHHNKTAFFGAAGVQVSIQNMLYILGI